MICLTISIIFLILKLTGVVDWPNWVISLPVLCAAGMSLWLLIKAEFEYMKNYMKNNEPEVEE